MLIQATDGRFYKNPILRMGLTLLGFRDDNLVLLRPGRVSWGTLVKGTRSAGLYVASEGNLFYGSDVVKDILCEVTLCKVRPTRPIPVPDFFELVVGDPSGYEGEIWRIEKRKMVLISTPLVGVRA